jgi:hypothetical protein
MSFGVTDIGWMMGLGVPVVVGLILIWVFTEAAIRTYLHRKSEERTEYGYHKGIP